MTRPFGMRRDRARQKANRGRSRVHLGCEGLESRLVLNGTYTFLGTGALTQDWSNSGLIAVNNDWSQVPSIEGYRGDDLTTATDADPRLLTAPVGPPGFVENVIANQSDTSLNTGGIAEFDGIPNRTVAFQGSGTADAPGLVFFVDTTNVANVRVQMNLRDIDLLEGAGTGGDTNQQINIQYRVVTSDPDAKTPYTNVTGGYFADVTDAGNTKVTAVDVTLPAAANNQAKVQIRVFTVNAGGSDAWVGIDDINISATSTVPGSLQFSAPTYSVTEGTPTATVTVTRAGGSKGVVGATYTPSDGSAVAPDDYDNKSGTISFADGDSAPKTFAIPIVDDGMAEPTETVNLALSAPTGGATLGAQNTAVLNIVDNDNFGSFQFNAAGYSVDESAGTVTIRVDRVDGAVGAKSVTYTTSDGTAIAPGDYASKTATLDFADGETFKTFTISIANDTAHELTETFAIALSNPTGGSKLGTPTTTTVSILDNDAPTGILLNEINVDPPGTDQPYSYVELRGPASADLSNVYFLSLEGDVETTPGSVGVADLAIPLSAYAMGTNGLLVITATSGGFTIPAATTVVGSTFFDPNASQSLEHASNSFLVVYSPTTILRTTDLDLNDDGKIDNLPTGAVVLDGIGWLDGSNAADQAYGAILAPQFTADIPADAATRGNSSTPLSPTAWAYGELLDAGDPGKSIAYDPANSNTASGYVLTPGDVNPPYSQNGILQFSVADYQVTESGAKVTIKINREGGKVGDISVHYATSDGTAKAGSDYTAKSNSVGWIDGESDPITFTVDILQDTLAEATEQFNLTLSAPTGGAVIGARSTATVSIIDDDSAGALQFSTDSYTVNEAAGTATITVSRIGGTVGAVSVNYATSNGTATSGSDYTAASGVLNFADGKSTATFAVPITNDTINEPTETVTLTLSNPTGGAALGSPLTATLNITDNDAPTVLLNEISVNPPATDQPFEYIELRGPNNGALNGVYVVSIEGDNNPNNTRGTADIVFPLVDRLLGSNGLLVIKSTTGGHSIPAATTLVTSGVFDSGTSVTLENGSNSFLVIYSPVTPIVQGTDYDPTDSKSLTLPAGAMILDGLGWLDTDDLANDVVYGGVTLTQSTGTPDAATRFPSDNTPLSVGAWYNGDLLDDGSGNASKTYDTGKASANIPANAVLTPGAANFGPAAGSFSVSTFTATASGFKVVFSAGFDATVLNLYDTESGGLGDADAVLEGASNGQVAGSLIVDVPNKTVTFVATGGILPADDYTVTLRSGADGFISLGGDSLDGDGDGTGGDNYTNEFTVGDPDPATVVISIPDFARGANQDVNLPADAGLGIPLTLSDATGVLSLDLNINYDPTLITFLGATVADGVPGTVTFNPNFAPGVARLAYSSATEAGSGETVLLYIQATIPADAPYTAKEVLDLNGDQINEGAIASIADDAVHVAAYFGDSSGNADLSAFDGALMSRVSTGLDGGFAAYQLADPVIVGDVSGNGEISSFDSSQVRRFTVGFSVPQIPDLPDDGPTDFDGLDPKISIGRDLVVLAGGTIRVPVYLDQTDVVPVGLDAIETLIGFDASRFTVTGVSAGSLSGGFALDWNADASGTLFISAASSTGGIQLTPGAHGTIAWIDLAVRANAAPGASSLNLLATGKIGSLARTTRLDEGHLVLIPAPTNAPDDAVDGVITVAPPAKPATPVRSPISLPSVNAIRAVDVALAHDLVDDLFTAIPAGADATVAPADLTVAIAKRRGQAATAGRVSALSL